MQYYENLNGIMGAYELRGKMRKTEWMKEGDRYQSYKDGTILEAYPVRGGWEYTLYDEARGIEYDSLYESSNGGDHARTPEIAMGWAERTLEEWEEEVKKE